MNFGPYCNTTGSPKSYCGHCRNSYGNSKGSYGTGTSSSGGDDFSILGLLLLVVPAVIGFSINGFLGAVIGVVVAYLCFGIAVAIGIKGTFFVLIISVPAIIGFNINGFLGAVVGAIIGIAIIYICISVITALGDALLFSVGLITLIYFVFFGFLFGGIIGVIIGFVAYTFCMLFIVVSVVPKIKTSQTKKMREFIQGYKFVTLGYYATNGQDYLIVKKKLEKKHKGYNIIYFDDLVNDPEKFKIKNFKPVRNAKTLYVYDIYGCQKKYGSKNATVSHNRLRRPLHFRVAPGHKWFKY